MKIVKIEIHEKKKATKHSWIQRLAIKYLKIVPLIQYDVSFKVILEEEKSLLQGTSILLEDKFLHVSEKIDQNIFILIPCKYLTIYQIHHILKQKQINYSPDLNFKRHNYEHGRND